MLSTVRTTLTSNTYHTMSISENISYNILYIITKTFHDWFVFEWELMTAVAKGLGNVKMRERLVTGEIRRVREAA